MIITRTPLRISFVGGMSDIPSYYERDYGCVINTAINKYIYIIINKRFLPFFRIKYSETENVDTIDEIKHPIIRECLKFLEIKDFLEITCISEIPSKTGLGSSSAFTVGLLHALHKYRGDNLNKKQLAEEACHIEINILKNPIGKQDQYASSFGGCNYIHFTKEDTNVIPLKLPEEIQKNLLLCYIGKRKENPQIHEDISINMESNREIIDKIRDISLIFKQDIEDNKILNTFGAWINSSWYWKQKISGILSPEVSYLYEIVMKEGALGAKLLGEGGSGFLLIYPKDNLIDKLNEKLNLKYLPFEIDYEGSKVIYEQ